MAPQKYRKMTKEELEELFMSRALPLSDSTSKTQMIAALFRDDERLRMESSINDPPHHPPEAPLPRQPASASQPVPGNLTVLITKHEVFQGRPYSTVTITLTLPIPPVVTSRLASHPEEATEAMGVLRYTIRVNYCEQVYNEYKSLASESPSVQELVDGGPPVAEIRALGDLGRYEFVEVKLNHRWPSRVAESGRQSMESSSDVWMRTVRSSVERWGEYIRRSAGEEGRAEIGEVTTEETGIPIDEHLRIWYEELLE